ncbi:carbohydrate ABC transporter permease [Alicyclobacillus fastidiosus]|uniref:Carbohydrate ABC transporter permease n=1 Tax=Alicyclobacillus fastidiosus TaxID=392011 RepID=A0ABY6ZAI6_9BACL|nr:carbohydrate ABC transporter permease [Alicyclobacillus fastidiosus]WAH39834.1 carbohydrate ABC transporter permease [Alicyclobacillus fastidiosus]
MRVLNTIRESRTDRLFMIGVYVFLSIVLVIVAYPLIYVLSCSFSSASAVIGNKVWLWPVHPTLLGYKAVFQYSAVWTGYLNSLIYTVGFTVISVLLTIMMAYPLSRKDFYGRKLFIWLLLFAMMFYGGLIPFYLVVKDLGLLNTRWSIILPTALNIFAVIIAKTFFQSTIPNDLYDSAQIDGCSDVNFLIRIVLPLSKPIIAVLVLWAAVWQWNTYFNALIFLNNQNLFPLQLVLRQILILNTASGGSGGMNLSPEQLIMFQNMQTLLKYSLIIVASVPVLFLYPLAQKYFVKGVMIGSVKE